MYIHIDTSSAVQPVHTCHHHHISSNNQSTTHNLTIQTSEQKILFGNNNMNTGHDDLFGNKNGLFDAGFVIVTTLLDNKQNEKDKKK